MGNIDEKRLSSLQERINHIKEELAALEGEVLALGGVSGQVSTDFRSTDQVSGFSVPGTEPVLPVAEADETPVDNIPIDIDIPDLGLPPIIEDPAIDHIGASTNSAADDLPDTGSAESDFPATETAETPAPTQTIDQTDTAAEPTSQTAEPDLTAAETAKTPVPESPAAGDDIFPSAQPDDLPFDDDLPLDETEASEPEPVMDLEEQTVPQVKESKSKTTILDSKKAGNAVMDVMAEKQAWRTDRPGSQVKNVISAISLNDRVLLINVLFREDPILFQGTISAFNGMSTLDEAVSYIQTNFPDWDMNSEPVYRLMMAVRRKLR